jgi:circadian clock protein KaiC
MATTTRLNPARADSSAKSLPALPILEKCPTGIKGLDEISGGGLPRGRSTILCGGPGSGKTMLGLEFLVRGAIEFKEPGVLMAFEEPPEEMIRNVASLGFDLKALSDSKRLFLDYVRIEPSEIEETGEYDLEGLFVRLQHAIDSVGAKRVMLDTLEALFTGFSNLGILRSEIRRLFRWLKEKGLTTVITAEQGEGKLTRHGLEEYVSDCVVLLDHRLHEQTSTRRLRIVKYRGTRHSGDEYPFLIDERGLSVLPISSLGLEHKASTASISSGVRDLDEMLAGKGFYQGSTVLVSGTAGTGKTTLSGQFAEATCRRGEKCLYIGFEESTPQLFRNLLSVGIDLQPWAKKNLMFHRAWRPTQYGMEMHLLRIHRLVQEVKPQTVVIDPITSFLSNSTRRDTSAMLTRLIDFLKTEGITTLFTHLTKGGASLEATEEDASSLIDSWILLRDVELNGERNRCVYVLKSRGTKHSNQLREFLLTDHGIELRPVYLGAGQVLTGSSRLAQEARDLAEREIREQEIAGRKEQFERKRRTIQAQIEAMNAELASEERQFQLVVERNRQRDKRLELDRAEMASSRKNNGKEKAQVQSAGGRI